jgi:AcrR family transcriptional regulator
MQLSGGDLAVTNAGGRPTKAQAAARDEALLDAARRLFSERGYAGTSIDQVAATLGWSKHTIYNRHAGKLPLLEAVVDRDVGRFIAALEGAGEGTDPLASLRAMASTYFVFSASPEYAALYAAITLEAANSAHLRERLQAWAAAALKPMLDAIAQVAQLGPWQKYGVDEACQLLIDLLDGEASRAKWDGIAGDHLEQRFERRWKIFRRMMFDDLDDERGADRAR